VQDDEESSPPRAVGGDIEKWFRKGKWSTPGNETHSGCGSTLSYTEGLRKQLPQLLREYWVTEFFDAPCGDFNWMRLVDLENINYIGGDIVSDIVSDNNDRYLTPARRFLVCDITKDRLPRADLMMCRDCLFHLTFRNIKDFLVNFIRSKIPLLLLTSHEIAHNRDLSRPGQFRQLNMLRPPFNFPVPARRIEDWVDGHPRRYLGLWTRDEIAISAAAIRWPS